MKKLQGVTTGDIEAATGRFDEIAHVALVNLWRCRSAAALQTVPSRSCKALDRLT
ncbi:MAG: hypothetical protein ND866_19910 [Pyrinomonadaceae bacterium]|nr:hypothetical protein [Pyrinomonadaceae bacterium]